MLYISMIINSSCHIYKRASILYSSTRDKVSNLIAAILFIR